MLRPLVGLIELGVRAACVVRPVPPEDLPRDLGDFIPARRTWQFADDRTVDAPTSMLRPLVGLIELGVRAA